MRRIVGATTCAGDVVAIVLFPDGDIGAALGIHAIASG